MFRIYESLKYFRINKYYQLPYKTFLSKHIYDFNSKFMWEVFQKQINYGCQEYQKAELKLNFVFIRLNLTKLRLNIFRN
jgi:hypothetical protein